MSESASPAATAAAPTTTKQPRATSLHPAAAVVRDQPLFTVEQFSVAGDCDTINGKIFAGTSADDLRQGIPWNARHEAIFAGMLARGNSRLCLHPETRVRARTQTGEPISLYLQALPSGAGTAARDDLTLDGVSYAAVIEGGRQRRRCAEAAGQRLKWIADTFGAPLRAGKVPGRMVKFRNAILGWLASPEGKASDEAAWLTESLVLDLIANPEVKDTFVKRSQILKEIRAYLDEKGFLEVDTPILTPFEIGASARPFYTHHNSLNMDMVLRIETELYLKRLIVGGMDRVYEVGRIFRNEGMDPKHNPEFTSIELYQAFTDFHGMMDLVEELYKRLAQKICGSMVIPYQGKQIDMGHWERLTMVEAVKKYSGVDFNDWKTDEDAIASAKEHHVELPEVPTKGAILAEFFDAFVEDKLIQPTFIYDYPVEISPLAKRKPTDPAFTERFEYFIDCTEYGNAFSELNDPIDQKGRFERQVAERKAIEPDCKAQVDYDYVNALEYGLPPTGGLGFGVDRLVMLLTDSASIRDVLLFPTMKPIEQ